MLCTLYSLDALFLPKTEGVFLEGFSIGNTFIIKVLVSLFSKHFLNQF